MNQIRTYKVLEADTIDALIEQLQRVKHRFDNSKLLIEMFGFDDNDTYLQIRVKNIIDEKKR
ncbi:MAG TPA: hypothetical protein VF680_16915 [Allosphingosinicella sp.]|jgi:hypothetical protein